MALYRTPVGGIGTLTDFCCNLPSLYLSHPAVIHFICPNVPCGWIGGKKRVLILYYAKPDFGKIITPHSLPAVFDVQMFIKDIYFYGLNVKDVSMPLWVLVSQ